MIHFEYHKEQDSKCWQRFNDFIARNKDVWGISKQVRQIFTINSLNIDADVGDIIEKYEAFFSMKAPRMTGYFVTTPFSMIDDDGDFSADSTVFLSIFTANPSVVLAHELFHVFFEKYTKRKIPDYETAKEYFTVLINEIFGREVSKGYPQHQEQRASILEIWKQTHSLDMCIEWAAANSDAAKN